MDAETLKAALAIKTPEDVAKLLLENQRLRADNETLLAKESALVELAHRTDSLAHELRQIQQSRDYWRDLFNRVNRVEAIGHELQRTKLQVCDLAAERDQLRAELAEAAEHLHAIWTIGYQADEARAEAIDSWISRNGHLMSDLLPTEGCEDA